MIKKILPFLFVPFLWSCAHTDGPTPSGVTPVQMPALPAELSKKAERLPDITDNTMGGQVRAGVESDTAYNDVAYKHNKLIDLYVCVSESMNKKEDPTKCLKK